MSLLEDLSDVLGKASELADKIGAKYLVYVACVYIACKFGLSALTLLLAFLKERRTDIQKHQLATMKLEAKLKPRPSPVPPKAGAVAALETDGGEV